MNSVEVLKGLMRVAPRVANESCELLGGLLVLGCSEVVATADGYWVTQGTLMRYRVTELLGYPGHSCKTLSDIGISDTLLSCWVTVTMRDFLRVPTLLGRCRSFYASLGYYVARGLPTCCRVGWEFPRGCAVT